VELLSFLNKRFNEVVKKLIVDAIQEKLKVWVSVSLLDGCFFFLAVSE
jgi:hypothetical protein